MKFVPVIRLICWIVCSVLVAVSFGVMRNSVIGGLLMLSGAIWLCPASWRAIESLTGKGCSVAVVVLSVPLFLLGVHITTTARELTKTPAPQRIYSEGEASTRQDAADHPEVNPGALNFFRHIMEQDYLVALDGGKSALNELAMVNPMERMPSSRLAQIYEGDEEAVDPFFKGRKLIVTGEVLGVRVDYADDVVLELPGAHPQLNVQAELHSDPRKYSEPVVEGKYVDLYCTVFGKVSDDSASSLYLKDCTEVDFTPDAKAYADNLTEALRGWLRTGGKHIFPNDNAATYFLVSYLAGTQLPPDNPCLREDAALEECVKSLDNMQASALFENARGDLQRWQEWLGLPTPEGYGQLSSR
ncbi:hypothetical protein Pres01_17650 [Metapseudomonas resinovorans]|uniref:hypothetical protein n=1 Tax=Metapseudomonas resinovorans TaxID=53412 RepID=UPI000984ADF4|nr:hypothetical protein [Pseudomonas resinovorans]GLZ85714.1 hypothetical protein Pres01_17650 [Pseudomonas resinovorans]